MIKPARILLAPYLVVVLLLTWLPGEDAGRVTGIVATIAHAFEAVGVPFDVGYPVLEFLANVALFAPLGALCALAWPHIRFGWIVAAGGALSVLIELVQLAMPSRYSTVSDVIANTAGTALGFAVVVWVRRLSVAGRTVDA